MLRTADSIRFTCSEVDDLRTLGVPIGDVKSRDDFAAALEPWLEALAEVRPDLLEKIARDIAAAKGIRLPGNSPSVAKPE
jgi:hypothetical protein